MTTAFIFPGQGSQAVGMLVDISAEFPQVEKTFTEASQVLGYDLWQIVRDGPSDTLNRTEITQPAMLAAGLAIYRILADHNKAEVSFMAGHSLGEYTALTASGVLTPADAFALVKARGEFMQSAVPAGTGAMAAILGLTDEQVIACCAQASEGEVVSAVNFNSPGQVVIAGTKSAVERAMQACKDAGAKRALPLPVSVPSHCALMIPASEQLSQVLANVAFMVPQVSVINNVDVQVETDSARIKQALIRQLYSPVRWVETVTSLKSQGVTRMIELGPGKVLAGLVKRIDSEIEIIALSDLKSVQAYLS